MNRLICIIIAAAMATCSCGVKNKVANDDKAQSQGSTAAAKEEVYKVMFYNVENLFDTENDPHKRDDEFTPEGAKFWTDYRYRSKLNNIYKVIVALGGWELPPLVAMSEVENQKVLDELLSKTPLYKSDYRIIHYESPDARGIDVALLYREKKFTPIKSVPIPVKWGKNIGHGTTRDILYVDGYTDSGDTLHIFVNHWPSRWGGQMETETKRMFVANLLRQHTDSILHVNENAKIIIVGDLNDYPTDKSVVHTLKAKTEYNIIKHNELYNLSYYLQEIKKVGSHKYNGQWGILDQIIVSGALLDTTNALHTTVDDAHVFNADFLLEPDEKFTGKQVNRTYLGYKYHGGFSDHLPVFIDLKRKK